MGVASAAQGEAALGEPAVKRAKLQMMDLQPLTVRGVGFMPSERVHVVASARGGAYSKTKVANAAGMFMVKFPVSAGVCRGYYSIRAFGSRGSRAFAITRLPQLDCIAPDSRAHRTADDLNEKSRRRGPTRSPQAERLESGSQKRARADFAALTVRRAAMLAVRPSS